MPGTIVVTAADAAYFSLLQDWLASVRSFPELARLQICVLDVGLGDGQRDWIAAQNAMTLRPDADIDLSGRPHPMPYYKAMTARPFLPKYFPDFDTILWLDADIWVQDPAFLALYLSAAERHGFAIAPEIDRAYVSLFGETNDPRLMHHAVYYSSFGRIVADRLIQFPIMSSGAFAARRNHPIWIAWQQACHRAMQTGPFKHSEQAALNFAIYNNNTVEQRPHLLPALANWSCALALPMWDPERRKLVEPYLPHAPIGLVHLNGLRDPLRLSTPQGGQIETAMTFAGIRSLMARQSAAG
jgi:hypothetical protein